MEALEERARRLNAAVNAHDLNPIGDFYADEAVLLWPGFAPIHGRQAIVSFYAQLLGAFPDVQATIKNIVLRGATIAVEYESRATNSGPLQLPDGQRLPPTGRLVVVQGVSYGDVEVSRKIRSQREYFDRVALLEQLGLMPSEVWMVAGS